MRSVQAYEELRSGFQSGRELEASVLLRAAHKLDKCAQAWVHRRTRDYAEQLAEALQFNQKLWTLLQMEIANPEAELPREIRLNMLQLGKYVDRITMGLCADGSLSQLQSLVRINQELAAGLLAGTQHSAAVDADAASQDYADLDVTA